MSAENVEIVRRAFEAFNRDGPEASLAGFAPDVEWHDLADQPDAEVHHGHAGYLAAMEQFFGELEDYRVNLDEIIDHGEQVVGCVRVIGRGRTSGARFEQRLAGCGPCETDSSCEWFVRNAARGPQSRRASGVSDGAGERGDRQSLVRCVERRRYGCLSEFLAPDAIWRVMPDWPEPGPYVGREAVLRQVRQLREAWDTGLPPLSRTL